ncbi:hypothetical protein T552_02363 [Pneumocystis carinii B80]|uniref:Fork-head domain-containing protein n=1 Tax=Pneumocystis carinii (strain B80) TaxID=1408658 RepID=A0A0W4ZG91_PNEC8|nr:hypothetical protein T552_02363 [Pneumocystis carinii B80]KTW27384.1 hypothetical protein T552_02363 [Pneumocystis carinii B80]
MATHLSYMASISIPESQYTITSPAPLYSVSPSKIFRQDIPRSSPCKSNISFKSTSSLLPSPMKSITNQHYKAPSKTSMKISLASQYPPPPTFSKDNFEIHSPASLLDDKENMVPNSFSIPNSKLSKGSSRQDSHESSKNTSMPLQNLVIPEPHEMPLIEDDGQKPPYSYATLIGMAILRAPQRRLTLSAIYHWISHTFEYYCNNDSGWQNSIRHNLSLNKAFVKQERPKDEPGKGNYWTIEPGYEFQFMRGRTRKNTSISKRPTLTPSITIPQNDKKRSLIENIVESDCETQSCIKRSKIDHNMNNTLPSLSYQHCDTTPSSMNEKMDILSNKNGCLNNFSQCQTALSKQILLQNHIESHSTGAMLDFISPPVSPRHESILNPTPYSPLTPILTTQTTSVLPNSSPTTCLRKHRDHIIKLLGTSENNQAFAEEDLWGTGSIDNSQNPNISIFEDDDIVSKACFGSPDKREAKRREIRRSLISGLHSKELYAMEGVSEVIDIFGIDIVSIVRREIERIKRDEDSTSGNTALEECLA